MGVMAFIMEDMKRNIARNISALRRHAGLTQLGLAEELNYSDKAISKWERGESIPDVTVLKKLADRFGVTVDYLLAPHDAPSLPAACGHEDIAAVKNKNRLVISMQATAGVWLVATIIFVVLSLTTNIAGLWKIYIYAIPASCVIALIFNTVWGRHKKLNYLYASLLVWSVLFCVYLIFIDYGVAQIFFTGIPAQIIILLWSRLRRTKFKKGDKPNENHNENQRNELQSL